MTFSEPQCKYFHTNYSKTTQVEKLRWFERSGFDYLVIWTVCGQKRKKKFENAASIIKEIISGILFVRLCCCGKIHFSKKENEKNMSQLVYREGWEEYISRFLCILLDLPLVFWGLRSLNVHRKEQPWWLLKQHFVTLSCLSCKSLKIQKDVPIRRREKEKSSGAEFLMWLPDKHLK